MSPARAKNLLRANFLRAVEDKLLLLAAEDLRDALRDYRDRYHSLLVANGHDTEYADLACQKADAALVKAERR